MTVNRQRGQSRNNMSENVRPSYEQVASMIYDGPAPRWLVKNLAQLAAGIAGSQKSEDAQPARSKMRDRLLDIQKAAEKIIAALSDGPVLAFIEGADTDFMNEPGQLIRALKDLSMRAATAAKAVRSAKGRGRAWSKPDGLSAHEICALVIVEAWRLVRGRSPGVNNGKAYEAADAYWCALGGWSIGEAMTGWRRHFQTVRGNAGGPGREMIREKLIHGRPKQG